MNKIGSTQAAPGRASDRLEIPAMMTASFETMMSAHHRVFEQIEAINRLWIEAVQEANSTGAALSSRLVKCKNPAEGATLCNEWVRERAARFASDSQEAAKLWMALCGAPFAAADEAAAQQGKDEDRGTGREKHPSSKAA